MSVYEFKAVLNNGEEISLEQYKGKVLLIINSVTGCVNLNKDEAIEFYRLLYKVLNN